MKVCTTCGYEGKPVRQKTGALAILFFTLAITTTWALASQLFWLVLPFSLISTALFIYWFFTTKCPKCDSVSMKSSFSPAARKYRKNPHTPTSNVVYSRRNPEADIYLREG